MAGRGAAKAGEAWVRTVTMALLGLGLVACVAVAVAQADVSQGSLTTDHADALKVVLVLSAAVAGVMVASTRGRGSVSAAFITYLLAAAFLGPLWACALVVVAELASDVRRRTSRHGIAINLLGGMAPALVAANLIHAIAPRPSDTPGFYLLVAAAGVVFLVLNFTMVVSGYAGLGEKRVLTLRALWELIPSLALSIALAVAGAAIYLKIGLRGIIFALIALFAFSYMAYLLEQSRHRAQQYVSLSWGVLAGLVRSLDTRDQRSARHAAAVAGFARDMARKIGLSDQECELAHTAGLLHDIGRFALSDRVAERGRTLNEEDWMAIQRHPELGADMLRDLGMYGPVAEIVLTHHERIDGRGYPQGLSGDEIPEIAKIIAVAEVYDTLTASDTYRTRMSSFEALRELRRVAGSQLDARLIEVLAELLSGEGVEYRHADAADFDSELDMERRIREAGARG